MLFIQKDPTKKLQPNAKSPEESLGKGFSKIGYYGEESSGSKFRFTTADGQDFYFTFQMRYYISDPGNQTHASSNFY